MTLQELEANFRALQAKGEEFSKQAKELDKKLSAARWDESITDEQIDVMEEEQKRVSKLAIHELNAANAALIAWKKAEKEEVEG